MKAGSRLICYFPNWAYHRPGYGKYAVDDINATLHTDMVYAFAILDGNTYNIVEFDHAVVLGL
ncbi:hypothetical protein DAPPUDRAFT_261725 [Daphnia pulex]|uniref:GH18 domain-containing protein n=1 Tax=Daphnia pulex TaxID=6669 RepID=E9HLJ7_DAPPU|nr:hypothetical protein DAPPUDRAFT_261725 [Daphnia pulex]|eukprot:EFX67362.1 hypothetical protein DAPPUDRAFT_261725 [Daphnia pulex]